MPLDDLSVDAIKEALVNRVDSPTSVASHAEQEETAPAVDVEKVWNQVAQEHPDVDPAAVDAAADARPELFGPAKDEDDARRQFAAAHELARVDEAVAIRDDYVKGVADAAIEQATESYDGTNGYELLDALAAEGLVGHPAFAQLFNEISHHERDSLGLEDHESTDADHWLEDHHARQTQLQQVAATRQRIAELEKLDKQVKTETAAREKVFDEELRRAGVDGTDEETMLAVTGILGEIGELPGAENPEEFRAALRKGLAATKTFAKAVDDTAFRQHFREVALPKGGNHFNHKTGEWEIPPATVAESLQNAELRTSTRAEENQSIKAAFAARINADQAKTDEVNAAVKRSAASAANKDKKMRKDAFASQQRNSARVNRSIGRG